MSSAGGVMGIIGAVIGNVSQRIGARERTRALFQQATDLDINADIEEFNAKVTENDLRANLMKTLASNNVALSASGLAGGGSAGAAMEADAEAYGLQAGNVNLSTMLKTGAMRRQARSLRREGKIASITGNLNASASTLSSVGGSMGSMGG